VWLQVATAGTHKLIGGLARVGRQRRELGRRRRRLAVHEALVVAARVERRREMRREMWRHGHEVEVGREWRRRLLQRVHGVEVEWGRRRRRRRRRCRVQEVGRGRWQRRLEAVGFVFGWSGRAVGVVRAAER